MNCFRGWWRRSRPPGWDGDEGLTEEEAVQGFDGSKGAFTGSGDVAAYAIEALGAYIGAEAAADLLLHLGHAKVLLSLVIGEGNAEVVDKPQGVILALTQTLEKVLDFGLLGMPTAPWALGLDGIEGSSLIHQGGVLFVDLIAFMGGKGGLALGFGGFNALIGT